MEQWTLETMGNAHELNYPHKHQCRRLSQTTEVTSLPSPGVMGPRQDIPSTTRALQIPRARFILGPLEKLMD